MCNLGWVFGPRWWSKGPFSKAGCLAGKTCCSPPLDAVGSARIGTLAHHICWANTPVRALGFRCPNQHGWPESVDLHGKEEEGPQPFAGNLVGMCPWGGHSQKWSGGFPTASTTEHLGEPGYVSSSSPKKSSLEDPCFKNLRRVGPKTIVINGVRNGTPYKTAENKWVSTGTGRWKNTRLLGVIFNTIYHWFLDPSCKMCWLKPRSYIAPYIAITFYGFWDLLVTSRFLAPFPSDHLKIDCFCWVK